MSILPENRKMIRMTVSRFAGRILRCLILVIPVFLMIAPAVLLLSGSIASKQELSQNLKPILEGAPGQKEDCVKNKIFIKLDKIVVVISRKC